MLTEQLSFETRDGDRIHLGGVSEVGIGKGVNQDAFKIGKSEDNRIAYLIVADGLGSCKRSDEGSKKIVELAEQWICKKLPGYGRLSGSVANIFFKKLIESWNEAFDGDDSCDYDTTVHFAVYDQGDLLVGGVGDGMALISLDGWKCEDLVPAKGLFCNVTSSMCSMNIQERMEGETVFRGEYQDHAVLILTTDGISDDLVPEKKLTLPDYFRTAVEEQGIGSLQTEIL